MIWITEDFPANDRRSGTRLETRAGRLEGGPTRGLSASVALADPTRSPSRARARPRSMISVKSAPSTNAASPGLPAPPSRDGRSPWDEPLVLGRRDLGLSGGRAWSRGRRAPRRSGEAAPRVVRYPAEPRTRRSLRNGGRRRPSRRRGRTDERLDGAGSPPPRTAPALVRLRGGTRVGRMFCVVRTDRRCRVDTVRRPSGAAWYPP